VTARFKRSRRGPVTVTFNDTEAALLSTLFRQLVDLLDSEDRSGGDGGGGGGSGDPEFDRVLGISSAAAPPSDVALARLLPDAYSDDAESAAEFRRYTESDLRTAKHEAARTAMRSLSTPGRAVTLDDEQAQRWLGALNDVRLALGTRLEVSEDCDERFASLPESDPRQAAYQAYLWLGYLQETLVQALS
jgi:hypothetical protein